MSGTAKNHKLVLAERPSRGPITSKTFREESESLAPLKDGDVRVKIDYVSIDPTMRNWLNDSRSYMRPVGIGEVMRAGAIGHVVDSHAKGFAPGDLVLGTLGWQEYWQGPSEKLLRRTTPKGGKEIDHLGLFGTSGMTAYFGMFDIGRLKNGDVVVISGAAGSVGLIACQIALAHPKCKVVAIAGSNDKLKHLKELGCHHVLNYKDKNFAKDLRKVGLVDLYFDNVGGHILDLVLGQMQPYSRIVACGAIAAYNSSKPVPVYNLPVLVSMKVRMQGFIVMDYADRYEEGRVYLADLQSRGKMKYDYTIIEPRGKESGLRRCTEALEGVFEGKNLGKTVVRISNDSTKAKL